MYVIAHGGAGSAIEEPGPRQAVLDEAVAAGRDAETPLDAVVETVRVLESSPRFNAGVGGSVQSDGVVRTDAGVMTSDREVGAAASMPGVEHASEVARLVMEETPHVCVSGVHAVDLAAASDIEVETDLWSDRTREQWADEEPPANDDVLAQLRWLRDDFGGAPEGDDSPGDGASAGSDAHHESDTVGAVASDGETVAALTSTGGRWRALAGRVGDVPQVGSGFFCTHAGGASSTGAGEDIVRVTLARRAVDHLELGRNPQQAAELAIEEFEDITESSAGVVVMDAEGRAGSAFNSDAMQTGRHANEE
ncbi:isoaspartyl peptidase/L-asparaginase [Halomarina oriensis]|uniref:Plant-type L-asparaginase n=1 Tax=Halomarina oriensis TaxID=671145 RepID=A0A6B0GJK2_9EURY|nr:isoaspartyl peptidase/L-asparaginase [Halomarina oriensis]MWG35106.1 asparaginase [Halomarina oriensis]